MIALYTFISFIFIYVISIFCLQQSMMVSATKVGTSSCIVLGGYSAWCTNKLAAINQLPKECSSFFGANIGLDVEFDYDVNGVDGKSTDAFLNELIKTGKPVYITYSYVNSTYFLSNIKNFSATNTNIALEMKNVQTYLGQYTQIAGLLFQFTVEPVKLPDNFSQNFKSYLQVLKKSLSNNMDFGLSIPASYFVDSTTNSSYYFQGIDDAVDFTVINAYALNDNCSADLKFEGQTPVSGGAKNTLEKVQDYVNNAGFSKNKTYYSILMYPTLHFRNDICGMNYDEMCKYPELATDWCADTLESFYAKGKFFKANANGFIVGHLDLNDGRGSCKCGSQFPGFYAILNGFTDGPLPVPCPLFDRK